MSKLDAQRAIREARYASNSVSGPSRREAPEGGERCGHRSMNGRACTREAAHSEKSHRYS
jgi:hypothetical protein